MAHHFLTGAELTAEEQLALLDRASELKADRLSSRALEGRSVALLFEKPSMRTRVSFDVGVTELGGHPVSLLQGEVGMGQRESPRDIALVLSRMVHAIGVRTGPDELLEELAEYASVPVINMLSRDHHPCQALADLLTIRERFGTLAGIRLAYLGDGNNVAHSLMEAGALAGMDVVVCTPYCYGPHAEIEVATHTTLEADPLEAVRGAQVVYTDVWVSMGQDDEREKRLADLAPYQVTTDVMAAASRDAIFMHCLPAHRGEEVTAEVIDGPRSVVFQQAANRLPTEQALIHMLIERWR
jgi:ornithine carbamoyltransferase